MPPVEKDPDDSVNSILRSAMEKARSVSSALSANTGGTARRGGDLSPGEENITPGSGAMRREVRTRLVVIGCSTGGPAALQQVIPFLPGSFPVPVVIVQHIPSGFSKSLAEHLNQKSPLEVRHAHDGEFLRRGCVLVAPAGFDLTFRERGGSVAVRLEKGAEPLPPGGFRPSVDGVMTSAASVFGSAVVGVLMTGMGRDGALGMKAIKDAHGSTIAEAESTCVVYGMPRAAVEIGAADRVVALQRIAQEIINII